MRFLSLQLEDRVPDAKTVWLFRERLKGLNRVDVLFAGFHQQLAEKGYVARAGQMIDELLDQTEESDGNRRTVYTDCAYRSQDQEQRLADAQIDSQIC